jgi:hypothetical protein
MRFTSFIAALTVLILTGCQPADSPPVAESPEPSARAPASTEQGSAAAQPSRFDIYATVRLAADLSHLDNQQKAMIPLLIEASRIMDELYWLQAVGDKDAFLASIEDPRERRFAEINYGPWDRLAADQPFIESFGPKPLGAQFYPADMSKEEFEAWQQEGKDGLYSLVRRDEDGQLTLQSYSEAYAPQLAAAANLLREAAQLASDAEFANYLRLRADALQSDDFQPSDMAWMDMKDNPIELVIGPIETYEDLLFGYRAAYESYVLIKDLEWSERLARFAQYLPELQKGLPVPDAYKQETPGSDADLNAYDVVAEDQQQHITFDSFFGNTMFHEVAHGLGIKNTLDGSGTVRQALKEHASALEEGKADVLGLYMVQKLREKGEITEGEAMDDYVTFLAGIFRSIRFGASSAHGRANMIRFNFFEQAGAFSRDPDTGTYRVNRAEFEQAVQSLSARLLTLQGDGDHTAVDAFVAEMGNVGPALQADLDRLSAAEIPVDIVFEQGTEVLGL